MYPLPAPGCTTPRCTRKFVVWPAPILLYRVAVVRIHRRLVPADSTISEPILVHDFSDCLLCHTLAILTQDLRDLRSARSLNSSSHFCVMCLTPNRHILTWSIRCVLYFSLTPVYER